ncbi:MAG: hypothetical protein A3J93_00755 [Candidatus Magasanikbacteria bacterium RIFOXYC2_FULL_42_28]|uniref:SH3b domain-containing protein n=1 Tax=Candidatus Magasanikbacteria bacterium RIFOXYC2_FULL_42_28 TaxID=1798704 RepID=A0A1F6NY89_9BACT|nr:MAG: hypothetical protein A3J93_00755 [Candidatus Magasanikbacteria bacterium RIFOXYC2_FULL_42_28]
MPNQSQIFNRVVSDQEVWDFNVFADGIYLITIQAKAKNWRQNFKRLFSDDDLAVQVDDYLFTELSGKKREFKGPGTWNGNELKNSSKSVIILLPLKAGAHKLRFWVDEAPMLENISVEEMNPDIKEKLVLSLSHDASAIDFIYKNIEIENLEVKYNDNTHSQKSIETKTDTDTIMITIKRPQDKKVESVIVQFKSTIEMNYKIGRIKLYQDIILSSSVNLRSQPDDESKILESLADGEQINILEEVVIGKFIAGKSYVWHKVGAHGKIGYVLSSFVEIQGQEREKIIELIKFWAQKLNIESSYVLALAGCESRYKVYATGGPASDDRLGRGIFQLTNQLKIDLNDDSKPFYSPISDLFNANQNVAAGVSYFKWLNTTKYKKSTESFKKSVVAYNAGTGNVPVVGKLNLKNYEQQTQNLVSCVLENSQKKKWGNIWWPILLFVIGFFLAAHGFVTKLNYASAQNDITIDAISNFEPDRSIRISSATSSVDGMVYFLANTSFDCGAQNCHSVLFQLDTKSGQIRKIMDDVFGAAVDLFPSPDGRYLALVALVHGGVCNSGVYYDIIDIQSLTNLAISGYHSGRYTAEYVGDNKWQNNNAFSFSLTQVNCTGTQRGTRKGEYVYNMDEAKLLMRMEQFGPENNG